MRQKYDSQANEVMLTELLSIPMREMIRSKESHRIALLSVGQYSQ